jgi:polyribonucleotide nucleotidyltransferase
VKVDAADSVPSAVSDVEAEGENKRLNQFVAVTVVILTVFMGISKVKDDNIVQAMHKAKTESVDAWSEYQAARVKLHVDENGLSTLHLLESTGSIDRGIAKQQAMAYEADIEKYKQRSAATRAKAEALEAEYDRLNFHDDQFDLSDTFLSLGLALAAVAALVEIYWVLYLAWAAGGFGLLLGTAGFLALDFRPGWLAQFLGA